MVQLNYKIVAIVMTGTDWITISRGYSENACKCKALLQGIPCMNSSKGQQRCISPDGRVSHLIVMRLQAVSEETQSTANLHVVAVKQKTHLSLRQRAVCTIFDYLQK